MSEIEDQKAFVRWLRTMIAVRKYDVLFTISPVGINTKNQYQSMRLAKKAKEMGYEKGTPDMTFYEPKEEYVGLVIEFKSKTGTLTPEQVIWEKKLIYRGYFYSIARSCDEAIAIFEEYINMR